MYYELAKLVKDVVDVELDIKYENSTLELDIKIKIPIAEEIENAYKRLTS